MKPKRVKAITAKKYLPLKNPLEKRSRKNNSFMMRDKKSKVYKNFEKDIQSLLSSVKDELHLKYVTHNRKT